MDARNFFDMQAVMFFNQREERTFKDRLDPFSLRDVEFKQHFRFSKNAVKDLVTMLRPDLIYNCNRGLPLSPELKVCLALSYYGGGHFQRITALYGGISQSAFQRSLVQVTDAILHKKNEFIFMPNDDEMAETADRMLTRFGLPRFAMVGLKVSFCLIGSIQNTIS